MNWMNVDICVPTYKSCKVRVKIADFMEDYETVGYYDHKKEQWYIKCGEDFLLSDNVYAWKLAE